MNHLKTILEYYLLGVVGALIVMGFIHIYGLLFDTFYAYPALELLIKTPLTAGLPFGTLLWIGNTITKLPKTQNIYVKVLLKALTYYGIGFIVGLLLLIFIELYIFVFNEPYYYATVANIIAFALLLALPFSVLVRVAKKLIDENTIKSIER
ncbi:hypothetical protein [Flavobacterium aciduliphilum]|uniref:Uncharacterized protein n=1 Tax=Flavobacterium aciduliphilum TaxID=1101402 RepID=A0A328YIL9_9FLAO|nr:hypothetical protein [Flavobacterium aciduliphilum]RAR73799.1 hypothetical protein CLV55_103118 [Flavobacterium aciduliphilum]